MSQGAGSLQVFQKSRAVAVGSFGDGPFKMRPAMLWLSCEKLIPQGEGLCPLPAYGIDGGCCVISLEVCGVEANSGFKGDKRFVGFILLEQGGSAAIVGFGIVRIETQGFGVRKQRVVGLSLF